MRIIIMLMCCLIPCIGLAISAIFSIKGSKRAKEEENKEEKKGVMKAEKLKLFGRMTGCVSAVWVVLTLVLLNVVPTETKRAAVILCVLLVTLQYASTMVLIFVIQKKL